MSVGLTECAIVVPIADHTAAKVASALYADLIARYSVLKNITLITTCNLSLRILHSCVRLLDSINAHDILQTAQQRKLETI